MRAEDKWADKLRQKMDNYAAPLPDDMWKKIEHDMPAPRIVPMWRRAWSYAAAVAVLLVSSLTLWFWNSTPSSFIAEQNSIHQDVIRNVEQQIESAKEVALLDDSKEESADALQMAEGRTVAQYHSSANTASAKRSSVHRSSVNPSSEKTTSAYDIMPAALDAPGAMVVSVDDGAETEECEAETMTTVQHHDTDGEEMQVASRRSRVMMDREVMARNAAQQKSSKKKKHRNGGWAAGLSAGNIPYTSSHSNSGMRSLSPYVAFKYAEDASSILRTTATNRAFDEFHTEVKHKLPIVASASFRYHFTSHWSLETGLSYTLLSSDWYSAEGVNVYQKLHYIGIPLRASYNIFNSRFFTLYASAGGMMEKCVHAALGKRNGRNTSSSTESLSEKPFQWSVSAALGAQFNVVRHFSLFVEPGVAYYFDDNSAYQTIRKEHPCNFNLNLGLRVSFGASMLSH